MTYLRSILLITCATTALTSPLPPACTTETLANYQALTSGCTIGPPPTFTFSDFMFTASVTSGSPTLLTTTGITVTPDNATPGALALQFASSGFSVGNGEGVKYVISYTVDPPPPEIIRFASALDPPPFSGLAQVQTELCVGAAFVGATCPTGITDTLTVFQNGASSMLNDSTDLSGIVATLGVINTITLSAGAVAPGDPASFSSFSNTVVTNVPEPASGVLSIGALSLFLFVSRRARTKVS